MPLPDSTRLLRWCSSVGRVICPRTLARCAGQPRLMSQDRCSRIMLFLTLSLSSACGLVSPDDDPRDRVADAVCDRVTEIPLAQCNALASLYLDTDGDNWASRTGWLETDTPCSWHGITCQGSQVVEISLVSNSLSGSLPPELGGLGQIRTIELGDNRLTGPIPSELGSLIFLDRLSLRDNQLTGPIPAEFGNLGNLVLLALRNNQLTGTIPAELGALNLLVFLNLSGNQLSGTIPPELGGFGQLQLLLLENNQLDGDVPLSVGILGGEIQSRVGSDRCRLGSNPGLLMPGGQDFVDADLDGDGLICGLALGAP